jgi:hypothetical protein
MLTRCFLPSLSPALTREERYLSPIDGGTAQSLRDELPHRGVRSIATPAGKGDLSRDAVRSAENLGVVLIEALANSTLMMRQIRYALARVQGLKTRPKTRVTRLSSLTSPKSGRFCYIHCPLVTISSFSWAPIASQARTICWLE